MSKNYYFHLVILLSCLFTGFYTHAQVRFGVELLPDNTTYQVSMLPDTDYSGTQSITNSAQVTLTFPTGAFEVDNFQSITGSWNSPTQYVNPIPSLNRDYLIMVMPNSLTGLDYVAGQAIPLFTFENKGTCPGAIEVMDNATDPFFNNTLNISAGNQITILGFTANTGQSNAFADIFNPGSAICDNGQTTTCDLAISSVFTINETSCNANDGQIQISTTGGTAPIEYSIDNGVTWGTSFSINNVSPGSYMVKARNASDGSCEVAYGFNPVTIAPHEVTNILLVTELPSCADSTNGSITIGTDSDDPALQYSIDNGATYQSTASFLNLGNGLYNIRVREPSTNCEFTSDNNPVIFNITTACENTTMPPTDNCIIEYILEESAGVLRVSMLSNVSYAATESIVASTQLTLRAPTGQLDIANISNFTNATFALTGQQINPTTHPGFDFFSFSISNLGATLPFTAGVTSNLFSFNNLVNCATGSIQLIGTGDGLNITEVNGANVASQLSVSGFGSADAPVCVNANAVALINQCTVDTDGDGVLDIDEDLNGDGNIDNDDTDGDGIANYLDEDDDNDNINTIIEEGAPNGGDGNGDGIPDCVQDTVASNIDLRGIYRTLETGQGNPVIVHSVVTEAAQAESDEGYDYPHFLDAFLAQTTGTIDVNILYHDLTDFSNLTYRKYGPITTTATEKEWYDFPHTFSTETIGGQTVGVVSFQLKDNETGDSDPTVGRISDPGGLAQAVTPSAPATCEVEYILTENNGVYEVSMLSNVTYTTFESLIASMQVTVRAPAGLITVDNSSITDPYSGVSFMLSPVLSPAETPAYDYFSFTAVVSPGTTDIAFNAGVTVPLFTFSNLGTCTPSASDSLYLVGEGASFATPILASNNVASQLSTAGGGIDQPVCVNGTGVRVVCEDNSEPVVPPTPTTCDVEYILTENNGVYEVSMLSNVNYSTFESLIASMQVTIRSTAGLFVVDNNSITDPYTDVSFTLSPVLGPPETPGYDYYSFNAVVAPGTTEIPFNVGETVPLFTFSSIGACSPTAADSLYLVGDGAAFATPILASNNIASQLSTAGGGIDQPVCVNNKGVSVVCEEDTNAPPPLEDCEVQYILTESNGLYTISMYSDITLTQLESTISTMQITLRAPTGTLQVANIVENFAGTNFSITSPIINPSETPGFDYFSFTLSPFGTNVIPFNAGETVELFNFTNIGACSSTDSLYLVGAGAPFPIPIIPANNLESQLFTAGGGGFDTPVCVGSQGVAVSCNSDGENTIGNGCEIQYILEENNGLYEVKMFSDITWSVIERIISSMQITVRAPTGSLALNNDCIEENFPGTVFELASSIINPSETPGYDYFSFNLTSFGSNVIPFTAGETVSLFTFKNLGTCSDVDSLYLVGDGGAFPVPIIPNNNLPSQLFAAGGGGVDSPVCVDNRGVNIACTPAEECQITYILEDSADVHVVKMFSNVSFDAFERTISTMQVTMRAPTGIVTIDNNDIIENFAGTTFEITSPVISPSETPAYDYFSFTITPFGTTAIPFVAGDTVNLFHFKNSGDCSDTDSLFLVGNGAPFPIPVIANNNVESQLSTAGGGVDMPICVSRAGGSIGCVDNTPPPCVVFTTNATSTNPTDCNQDNGQIVINTTPANNSIYSINGGATWSTSNMFSDLPVGQYTIEVALADTTCNMVWGQITLTAPVAPVVTDVDVTQAVACGGTGSIEITASINSGLIYSVDGGTTWTVNSLVTDLEAGNYTIAVAFADTTCMTVWGQETLTEPASLSIAAVDLAQPLTCGGTGSLIILSAQTTGIIYSIDGGTTWIDNNLFTDLEAGNYTIAIALADTTCITVWGQETLTEPDPPAISSVNLTQPVACDGTGSIQITASPASGLIYSIDGGTTWSSTNLFTDIDPGNYVVAIAQTDTTCISIGDQETLAGSTSPIILSETPINPSGCGNNDGFIQIATNPATGLLYSIDGGVTWSTSNVFSGLGNGTYNIAVANADETCVTTGSTLELTSPTAPTITNVVPTNPTSCESANGQIQITANSTLPIIYSIDGGTTWSADALFTDLAAGFYTINIAHADTSCVVVGTSLSLTSPAAPIITGSIPTHPTNCAGTNGSIRINTIPNNLIYSIDGGETWATNPLFQDLLAGSYVLAIANSDTTCMVTGGTLVLNAIPSEIVSTIITTDPSGPNTMDGCIEIISSCSDNLEYSLNGGDFQESNLFCDLGNGIYSVRVRCLDLSCSEEPAPVELNSNVNSCASIITPILNTTLCDASSISLVLGIDAAIATQTITGGTTSNVALTNNDSTLTFDAQLNGLINFFTVTITTTTGCELVEEFVLYQAQNTEADFVVIEPHCRDAEVTIQFTGNATPNAALNWTVDGGTISNSSPATDTAPAGSEITVQWDTEGSKLIQLNVDDNGCTDEHIESIFIRKLPLVTVAPDTAICPGECVPLNGDGTAVWYTWSPADGLSATDIPNPIACPAMTTTYTLTAMSADGCIDTRTVTVTVDEVAISVSANATICEGDDIQLMANGGTNYTWSPTTGLSDPSIANPIASPAETTTYMVTATNDIGCSEESSVTVTVNPSPILIISEDAEICQGESTQLTVNTHSEYAWSPATGLSSTTIANPIANPTSTTTYTVVVTDIDGCTTTGNVTVTVNAPEVNATVLHDTICSGFFTQLTATGGVSYSWSPATGLSDVSIANPTAMPGMSTEYCVTVTDIDGCTSMDCIDIVVDNETCTPCFVSAGTDAVVCGTIGTQLNASGSFTYVWSPTTGLSDPNIANPFATPSQTTTYTVTGTSADGFCIATDTVTVTVEPQPEIITYKDKYLCRGDSIYLLVNAHESYAWSPTNTLLFSDSEAPLVFPTSTTVYTVTVTSANGCTNTENITVTVSDPNNGSVNAGADETICSGEPIQLLATGGSSYTWSPNIGLNNPNIANPIANPTVTTQYCVTTGGGQEACSSTDCLTITIDNTTCAPPICQVNGGVNTTICVGASTQLNATGASTYVWSPTIGLSNPNIANPTASPSVTTLYTVTGTNIDGCVSSAVVNVFVEDNTPLAVACEDKTICSGESIRMVVNNNFAYAWSQTTPAVSTGLIIDADTGAPTVSPSETTTYTIVVTNEAGCTDSDEVTIFVNTGGPNGSANAGSDETICEENSVRLNATGGATFTWAPTIGLNDANIPNPIAAPATSTTYCVTVVDFNGCTSTDCLVVTVEDCTGAPPTCQVTCGSSETICDGESVQLNATGALTYTWSPSTGLSNSQIANPIASPSTTTTYTITGTTADGCVSSAALVITVENCDTPPATCQVNGGTNETICDGESVQLNATGALTYTWSPSAGLSNYQIANPIASPSTTTTYTVTGISADGCVSAAIVTVNIENCNTPSTCQVNGGPNQAICGGESVQLNATGALTYTWSPSAGLSNSQIANPIASPSSTTTYTVTGINAGGCVSSAIMTVTVENCNTPPSCQVNAGTNETICDNESVQLNATGALTYTWSPSAGLSNSQIANPIASPSSTTTYTVTGRNAAGCVSSAIMTVTVENCNTPPSCQVNGGTNETICNDESVQLNATGALTYSWFPSAGLSNAQIANPIASPLTTTIYTVTGNSSGGCVSSAIVMVTVENCNAPPACQVRSGTNETICSNESIQLNATNALTYSWSPSAGLSNAQIANPIASPTTTTTYTVTGINADGCVSSAIMTVTVENCNTSTTCQVNGGTDETICDDESVQLNATGALTYNWSPSIGLSNAQIANPIASPSTTTTYTVTGRNADGCVSSAIITVNVENCNTPAACQVNAGENQTICQGTTVQLNATGASTYTWSPSTGLSDTQIANPIASPSVSTTYTVTGINADGCTSSAVVTVSMATAVPIADAGNDAPICPGGSTSLFASGGVSYEWSPSEGLDNPSIQNPIASPTSVTTYTVTVTDENGCTDTDEVRVMVSLPITTSVITTDASCCGIGGGSIFINASGGFGNLTYSWSSAGLSGNTESNLNAGGYMVTITDAQGCSQIESIILGRNCDSCTPIFSEEMTCVAQETDTAEICVPIIVEQLNDYIITVDGVPVNTIPRCNFENVISYSYSLIPGLNQASSFRVEEWELNGVIHSTEVMTISDLTDWMNSLDSAGQWVANTTSFTLTGGVPTNTYGVMKLVNQLDWNEALLQPNFTGRAKGVLISVDMRDGKDHKISVENTSSCCIDELILSFCTGDQPCLDDMIAADEIELSINDCDATAIFCIEIPFSEIDNYTIIDNGFPYENDIVSCAFGDTGDGTLLDLSEGFHELIFENSANGCQDRLLVDVNCPANTILDSRITFGEGGILCLGDIVDTSTIVSATQTCLLEGSEVIAVEQISDFCWEYTSLSVGMDRFCIEVCTDDGICKNIIQVVNVTEPEPATCPDALVPASLSASLTDCTAQAEFCIALPFDSIRQYGIMLDGAPFREALEPCEAGTLIRVGLGRHTLQLTHLVSDCVDSIAIKVDCPTDIIEVAETVEVNEMGIYCPDSTTLIGPITSIENICPEESGEFVIFELIPEAGCITYTGLEIGAETACIVVCDENEICDTIRLTVHVVDSEPRLPVAISDTDTTEENTPITLEIINNDSINGSLRIIEVVSFPVSGEVLMNVDHSITYVPEENYCELDNPQQFLYRLCNQDGCDTASVMIRIPCADFDIKTGFSPNGDGVNDVFFIQGLQRFPNNELKVYNRWGNLVFEEKSYSNQWAGTFEEEILPDATYFYVLDLGDGSKPLSGFVQINK